MLLNPLYLSAGFMATVLLSFYFLLKATKGNKIVAGIIIAWMIIQGIIASTGFYTDTHTMPPRFMTLLLPPFILMIILFLTNKGRRFIDSLDTEQLTWLHIVRIPVEICLFLLYTYQLVPQLMTFEGINFDILSGLTAPFIAYFGYRKNQFGKTILLSWNLICLGLLVNIAYHGILSVPTSFQKFGFEQPNIALTYFPYHFLPGLIVPLVLFAHLVCMRKLLFRNEHRL